MNPYLLVPVLALTVSAAEIGTVNPPPTARFMGYSRYELKPLQMGAPWAGQGANEKAAKKIQEHMDHLLKPLMEAWTESGKAQAPAADELLVEPRVEEIKFIGGAGRFFAGPLAGKSRIHIKVRISEKKSGKVLAEPEFYQHTSAWSGSFTVGGNDNNMLQRIVTLQVEYFTRNYASAVGGPTGFPDKNAKEDAKPAAEAPAKP